MPLRQRISQLYESDKSTRETAQYWGFWVRIPCGNYQTETLISGIGWDGPRAPWFFENSHDQRNVFGLEHKD